LTDSAAKRVLFIIGPTASGKSRLALCIARLIPSEIVSADSRQVYKAMDIGTAKPSREDMTAVRHHMVDILTPDVSFSAGEYSRLARRAVDGILERRRLPIVVGGSGLYIRALADGMFEGFYTDEAVRAGLKNRVRIEGLASLYRQLEDVDPAAARKIHPNDQKRILRALEVFILSGEPISKIQRLHTEPSDFESRFYGLDWPRPQLTRRIHDRVDAMVRSGLVTEAETLKGMGYGMEHNALDSVGYKEAFQYLEGNLTLEDMVRLIQRNTRRFAKRQMTWFRGDARVRFLPVSEPVNWDGLAERVLSDFLKS